MILFYIYRTEHDLVYLSPDDTLGHTIIDEIMLEDQEDADTIANLINNVITIIRYPQIINETDKRNIN